MKKPPNVITLTRKQLIEEGSRLIDDVMDQLQTPNTPAWIELMAAIKARGFGHRVRFAWRVLFG